MSLESASEDYRLEIEKDLGLWSKTGVSSRSSPLLGNILFVDADMETIIGSSPRVVGFPQKPSSVIPSFLTTCCKSRQVPELLLFFFPLLSCCLTGKIIQEYREHAIKQDTKCHQRFQPEIIYCVLLKKDNCICIY